eukprot:3332216-Heterocapsa_arctica.AAC.1
MGRVRRDLGFRHDPGELSRLSRSCGSPEGQMRERFPYAAGRERPCGFLSMQEWREGERAEGEEEYHSEL